jgi:hypothetical protein
MGLFRLWTAKHSPGDRLAHDATSFSTRSKEIDDPEHGRGKSGGKLPQLNLGCHVSKSTFSLNFQSLEKKSWP